MTRSRYASAIALAALLAAPAFAQTMNSTTSANPPINTATTSGNPTPPPMPNSAANPNAPVPLASPSSTTPQVNSNAQNPASRARQAAIDQGRTPLCSELDQPNAGKLANQTTGQAAENSASAVHMDCIPDSASTTPGVAAANAAKAKKKPAKTG